MYYVTEEQLNMFCESVMRLPVNASNDFSAADAWVGLYLALNKVRQQAMPDKPEDPQEEAKE